MFIKSLRIIFSENCLVGLILMFGLLSVESRGGYRRFVERSSIWEESVLQGGGDFCV